MDKVRIGVVGLGNMGSVHAKTHVPASPNAELTAVCDVIPDRLTPFSHVATFTSSEEMIRSGLVDAIIIATPHPDHTPIGIHAMDNGLHVLCEKPISANVADADRLIAAVKPGLVFEIMFQARTSSTFQTLKKLLDSGELGELRRLNWIVTNWFRSAAYYASGGWRATWKGEGGGVLLNQCPHNLDMFQWLFGMPNKITTFAGFGKYHDIEVEDSVTAYMEYPNGCTAVFVTSTGEAPGVDRLEIVGDRGKVVVEGGKITFDRTVEPVQKFSDTTPDSFPHLAAWKCDIPGGSGTQAHQTILNNFVEAIQKGVPLIAPGEEGVKSLELANGMLLSAWTGQTVSLPIDREQYVSELNARIASSRHEKKVVESVAADMSSSFH